MQRLTDWILDYGLPMTGVLLMLGLALVLAGTGVRLIPAGNPMPELVSTLSTSLILGGVAAIISALLAGAAILGSMLRGAL